MTPTMLEHATDYVNTMREGIKKTRQAEQPIITPIQILTIPYQCHMYHLRNFVLLEIIQHEVI